jgi:hypothetical protein
MYDRRLLRATDKAKDLAWRLRLRATMVVSLMEMLDQEEVRASR